MLHARAEPAPASPVALPSGLWVRRGEPPRMPAPHWHDDIEINAVLRGRIDYLFDGSPLTVQAGQIAVFWAATPHQLLPTDSTAGTHVCWIHLPLGTVLSWGLPEQEVSRLLNRTAVIAPLDCLPHDPDRLFAAWADEIADDHDLATTAPALLEAQALLRRLIGRRADQQAPVDQDGRPTGHVLAGVTAMAQFIVEHFREQITLDDIARSAHLNPTYAATIFSRTLRTTPGRYLNRCRVAEAQRLLITTDKIITEIAYESGFSSQSSFYDNFTKLCGVSPGGYRRRIG